MSGFSWKFEMMKEEQKSLEVTCEDCFMAVRSREKKKSGKSKDLSLTADSPVRRISFAMAVIATGLAEPGFAFYTI